MFILDVVSATIEVAPYVIAFPVVSLVLANTIVVEYVVDNMVDCFKDELPSGPFEENFSKRLCVTKKEYGVFCSWMTEVEIELKFDISVESSCHFSESILFEHKYSRQHIYSCSIVVLN